MHIHKTPKSSRCTRSIESDGGLFLFLFFFGGGFSRDETEKKLTLLPDQLTDAAKNAIKQAFKQMGVYEELSSSDTNQLLIRTSPRDYFDPPALTPVRSETGSRFPW